MSRKHVIANLKERLKDGSVLMLLAALAVVSTILATDAATDESDVTAAPAAVTSTAAAR